MAQIELLSPSRNGWTLCIYNGWLDTAIKMGLIDGSEFAFRSFWVKKKKSID